MRKFTICFMLMFILILCSVSAYAEAKLPVLTYHNITEDESLVRESSSVQVTPKVFEEHLVALKEAGYTTISLSEFYDYCTNGEALPNKPIIITFDDGYRSNYEYAFPLLKKHGQKAAIFVIASRMGADDVDFPHFTWAEALEMEKSGFIEIESHSYTHPDFSNVANLNTSLEMRLAKYAIELNLQKECKFFAYPYGRINAVSTQMATLSGCKMAFVGGDVSSGFKPDNMYQIPRFTVYGTYTGEKLLELIE